MSDIEYDAFDFKRPRKKRVSAITGRPTALHEETEIQIACVTYYTKLCRLSPVLRDKTRLYAVGATAGKRPPNQAVLAKRMGEVRGIYDLHFLDRRSDFMYHWIEVKAEDGDLTPEQEDFWDWLMDTPIKRHVVRSVDEFRKVLGIG